MGRRALGENVDDGPGLAGEVGRLRHQRPDRRQITGFTRGCADQVAGIEHRGETQGAEAHADATEELPATQQVILDVGRDAAAGMGGMSVAGMRVVGGHGEEGSCPNDGTDAEKFRGDGEGSWRSACDDHENPPRA
jgi:hypothetical protein